LLGALYSTVPWGYNAKAKGGRRLKTTVSAVPYFRDIYYNITARVADKFNLFSHAEK